ncbi:hypothetical protein [Rhodoferax sp.]|uniref:hypothetical protein n=1 Tax=Rhodoferax sp. TaxID=50421 RepID=UPI002ACE3A4E|nr:hypothetical protein [Rhodoferax sp.]MDZ7919619.1 hypothetical protein [Rhodoferax sp.]
MTRLRFTLSVFAWCAWLGLTACAQLPAQIAELGWQDLYGDRGAQVLARDYVMCTELTEQRRSLLGGCMAARGWKVATD